MASNCVVDGGDALVEALLQRADLLGQLRDVALQFLNFAARFLRKQSGRREEADGNGSWQHLALIVPQRARLLR